MRTTPTSLRRLCESLIAAIVFFSSAVPAVAGVSLFQHDPRDGDIVGVPGDVFLWASPTVDGGYAVSKVEYFDGATLIATSTTSPYWLTWSNPSVGSHTVTAKVTATKVGSPDQTATTSATISVYPKPTVSVSSPTNNAQYRIHDSVTFSATASADTGATIQSVTFRIDGYAQPEGPPFGYAEAVVTSPPYAATLELTITGGVMVSVDALDSRGVHNVQTIPLVVGPHVSLTGPENGSTFAAPATIPVGVTTDASGNPMGPGDFQYFAFYSEPATQVGFDYTGIDGFTFQNLPAGSYALKVVAYDDWGGIWISDAVNVTVAAPQSKKLYFIEVDHLNTPRLVANAAGQTVWRWDQQEPFGNTAPDENPSGLGVFDLPLRFPGQRHDAETGLHYNYYRNYDASIGGYKESDLIGLRGGLNTYAYGASNPLSLFDPSGLACTAIGGTVTCTPPGGPTVSFPRPAGWPAVINPNSPNYHSYNIAVQMGCANPTSVMQGIVNLPTPGSPQPATAQGTPNNATPNTIQSMANLIDQISSFGSDPGNYNNAAVISYLLTTPSGASVVVNVTQPGHPLWPGYVARTINGGSVNNFGEGAGWLQGPNSPFAGQINNVWQAQTQGIINNSAQRCGCQP